MFISNRRIGGLMPNLIKKSWTVSSIYVLRLRRQSPYTKSFEVLTFYCFPCAFRYFTFTFRSALLCLKTAILWNRDLSLLNYRIDTQTVNEKCALQGKLSFLKDPLWITQSLKRKIWLGLFTVKVRKSQKEIFVTSNTPKNQVKHFILSISPY